MLTTNIQELKGLNSCLRDEHTALQLAFASLEDKLRKVQVSLSKLISPSSHSVCVYSKIYSVRLTTSLTFLLV